MTKKARPEHSFWVSYSDLATGLMMVFMLVTCVLAAEQVAQVNDEKARIDQEKARLEATHTEINTLVQDVNRLAATRLKLATDLTAALSSMPDVKVDPVTARVTVSADDLGFAEGESKLSHKTKTFLDGTPQGAQTDVPTRGFIKSYVCTLVAFESHDLRGIGPGDPREPGAVSRVLVTGHADLKGQFVGNHELAGRRATSVVEHSIATKEFCAFRPVRIGPYLEARMHPASGGEIGHCLEKTAGDSDRPCSDVADESAGQHRTVTFEVELVGEDISTLALNLIALDSVVSAGAGTPGTAELLTNLAPLINACVHTATPRPECAPLSPGSPALAKSSALTGTLGELCAARRAELESDTPTAEDAGSAPTVFSPYCPDRTSP